MRDLLGITTLRLYDVDPAATRKLVRNLRDQHLDCVVCDSTALRDATGWAPAHSLEQGLAATVAWFGDAANLARYRPADYNL